MAFFGLTSLGAQNPFQTVQDTPLEAFDAADFTQAWTKVMTRDEGVVLETLEQLETIVRVIYHCPEGIATPADVWTIIRDHFLHSSLDDSFGALTFEQYLDRMTQARGTSIHQTLKPSCFLSHVPKILYRTLSRSGWSVLSKGE